MVYFVGAGCGAKDLITVRGMRLLEEADVIIYAGSLVNPELLEYAKENDVYVELLGDDLDKEYTKEDLLRIALNSKYDGIILEGNGIIDNRDLSDEEDDENLSEFDKLLNEAKEKNVPIITINEDVSTNYRKSFVCINRYILGREYGQQLCDYLDLHNRQKKSGSLDLSYDNDKYYTEGTKCVVKILYDEAQSVNNLTTVMSGIKSRLAEDKKTELFDIEIIPVDSESYYAAEEEVRDVIGDKEEDRPDVMICLSENLTSMAHSALAEKKSGWIDFDTGIITETGDVKGCGEALFEYVMKLASGEILTKNEKTGKRGISIFKDGVTL